MLRIGFRLACVLSWLALDAMVAWWLISAAGSFVQLEWSAASATALGLSAWLAAFLYLARQPSTRLSLMLIGTWPRYPHPDHGAALMPSRPPSLKQRPRAKAWATTRKTRQERGYRREHEIMRAIVLREEPLCRPCDKQGRVTQATIADHIKPLSEGGTSERKNYQEICHPCHVAKTAEESARARIR